MKKAVSCIAQSAVQADRIVEQLQVAGFAHTDISVRFPDKSGTKDFAHEKQTKAPEGATTGGTVGLGVGAVLGWLARIGSLARGTHPMKRTWIIGLVGAAAALVAGANRMKVMSWNIHASQGNFDGWVDTIGKLKPAVAGLNEVCGDSLRVALQQVKEKYGVEYHMQFKRWAWKPYPQCGPRGCGNAIISVYPMNDVKSHKYSKVDDEDRGFTLASVDVDGISKIRVYVTHLGLRGTQGPEAKQLAAFHTRDSAKHKGYGRLMFGDFNATPDHKSMEPLWDAGLKDANPNCGRKPNAECKPTFPDKKTKLDYIWYKGLRASDYHVSTTNHSDHWIPQANVSN